MILNQTTNREIPQCDLNHLPDAING